jgi:hypothetical protein
MSKMNLEKAVAIKGAIDALAEQHKRVRSLVDEHGAMGLTSCLNDSSIGLGNAKILAEQELRYWKKKESEPNPGAMYRGICSALIALFWFPWVLFHQRSDCQLRWAPEVKPTPAQIARGCHR